MTPRLGRPQAVLWGPPLAGKITHQMNPLRFNVFGRIFLIQREAGSWQAYALGSDGKRRPAGFVIPEFIDAEEVEQYLFDLFHESATPGNGDVRRIE